MTEEKDYLFVADANGLTSISPINGANEFAMVDMYCHANSHRHCMWGILMTDEQSADILQQHIDNDLGIEATKLLLDMKMAFPKSCTERKMKQLTAISEDRLQDPFGAKAAY